MGRVSVTLVRPLHVSKVGQSKEKGKTKQATLTSDFHAHGSESSLGRFVQRGVNIDDGTIHPSRRSRINPTLKVCKHNRVAHASGGSHPCHRQLCHWSRAYHTWTPTSSFERVTHNNWYDSANAGHSQRAFSIWTQ